MPNHLHRSTHHLAKTVALALSAAFLLGLVALTAWATPAYAEAGRTGGLEDWRIGNFASSLQPSNLPTLQPSNLITATKTYTLSTDSDGDNQADPGDVLSYTIVITNDGGVTATGLTLSDTLDANLSQLGLASVSPVAFDDSFNTSINPVILSVAAGSGLFSSDYPGLNPAVSGISSFGGGSLGGTVTGNTAGSTVPIASGGSLTVNANGSFDFTPAVSFQGVFTFLYRLQNFVGPSDGLVQITVDAPPTVTTTSPVNNAPAVNGASNITINFSENVAIGAGGITLDCGAGAVSFSSTPALPASGTNTITLDPTANLPGNAICTVTVLAANTTDSDANDPPDQLDGNNNGIEGDNYSFSFQVAPTANDDSFNVTPHLTLTSTTSVRANDDPTNVTITGFGNTLGTANGTVPNGTNFITAGGAGGRVVLNPDGTFGYYPDAGDTNTSATFFYTITGGDTAQVTLTLQNTELVWFVDDNVAGTTCTGSNAGAQACPLATLTGAVAVDTASDTLFVVQGSYTCGVILETGERVIGDGSSSDLQTITSITPVAGSSFPAFSGTDPTLSNAGGNCLTLGANNTIRGLTIGDTAATGSDLTGTNFGTLTVLETTLTGTGRALNLNTGSFNATTTFDGVTSTSGPNNVNLVGVGGTANLGSGTLSGSTGTAFNVSGGNATITYAGNVTQNNAQRVVDVQNTTGGAVNFTTGTVTGGASSTGININNANGNVSFANLTLGTSGSRIINQAVTINGGAGTYSLGAVSIFTNNAQGIVATNADGTINSTSGTVDAGQGTAINLDGPGGLTTLGMTLTRVDSSGGSATGLIIQDTSGSFLVNGDGVNTTRGGNGTGGTIANKSGADGSTTTGNGVYLSNASSVTLRRMTINGTNQNHGIRGVNISNFTLEYSTVSGTNGDSAALDEGSVNFDNLTGSAAITGCIIEGGFEDNLNVVNTSGTLNRLTITNTTFGFNNTVSGNNNILIEAQNAGTTLNFTLQSSLIKGARADWLNASNNSSSTMDALIGGSTLALGNTFDNLGANAHPGAAAGGNRVVFGAVGVQTVDIRNNTLKGSKGEAIRVRSTATGALTGSVDARVRNNVIGVAAIANSGSSESSGIFAFVDGGGDMDIAITDNQVFQYNNHGIRLQDGDEINDGSVFNATVTGNIVNTPGNINSDFNGINLNNGTVAATDNFISCVDIGGAGALANNFVGSGNGTIPPNNQEFRLQQRQSTTVRLPGYGGANNDNAAVVAYIQGRNTVTGGNGAASNTVPTGGGFIGGAACTQPSFAFLPNNNEFLAQNPVETNPPVSAQASSPNMNPADRFNTPLGDVEFSAATFGSRRYTDPASALAGRMDLLTALMHELGHSLNLADAYAAQSRDMVMYGYLTQGERRLPVESARK